MKVYKKKKELVQYVTIRAIFFQGITCVSEPLTILKDLKLRQKQEGRPTCMLLSELLKNPCLHRPWPPRVMHLLSGGGEGGDGRVLGESHGFQWKRRGGG